jgi:signal transduction histidine kinase
MYSEIMAQRQLSEAEHGDLNVKVTSIEILHFLKHIVNLIQEMKVAKDININISPEMKDFSFISDPVILNRVITNLLKNAVEASEPGQSVNIKGEKLNDTVVFTVHNESFIPRNIQLQIFQRSFSTKGEGRGLGTYSIRLLTEQYLKGKVHFTSDENKGTNFHITLPNEIGI